MMTFFSRSPRTIHNQFRGCRNSVNFNQGMTVIALILLLLLLLCMYFCCRCCCCRCYSTNKVSLQHMSVLEYELENPLCDFIHTFDGFSHLLYMHENSWRIEPKVQHFPPSPILAEQQQRLQQQLQPHRHSSKQPGEE